MFISLETMYVWRIDSAESPVTLLLNLGQILCEGDVLVVGSYELNEKFKKEIKAMEIDDVAFDRHYFETFDINRDDYPEGRAWDVLASKSNLKTLANLALFHADESSIKIDHLLAYRSGFPVLPIFNYHDAFNGGYMFISGLYPEGVIKGFSEKIKSAYKLVANPEFNE